MTFYEYELTEPAKPQPIPSPTANVPQLDARTGADMAAPVSQQAAPQQAPAAGTPQPKPAPQRTPADKTAINRGFMNAYERARVDAAKKQASSQPSTIPVTTKQSKALPQGQQNPNLQTESDVDAKKAIEGKYKDLNAEQKKALNKLLKAGYTWSWIYENADEFK